MTLAWALTALVVGLEIPYPLVSGDVRDALTVATVLAFFAASATHAAVTRGLRWALVCLGVATATGLAVEAVGIRTGVPFGRYAYTGGLGPRVLGVPAVIPLAWAMMSYPALLVARRSARRWLPRAVAGGSALASWDLFLDPQMVAAGHWRFAAVAGHLPGVPTVPLTNYLGWLAVAVVLLGVLDGVLPPRGGRDGPPATLYLWTFGSSVLANLAFFGRPWVALWGGLGMGAVVAVWAAS